MNKNSFDLSLSSFVFYTCNSLEKWSFTKPITQSDFLSWDLQNFIYFKIFLIDFFFTLLVFSFYISFFTWYKKYLSVGAKCIFLQLNCCNLYHQSRRENMKITVNIKVIKWHNENLLTLFASNKSLNNYAAVKLFHTLNTKHYWCHFAWILRHHLHCRKSWFF